MIVKKYQFGNAKIYIDDSFCVKTQGEIDRILAELAVIARRIPASNAKEKEKKKVASGS